MYPRWPSSAQWSLLEFLSGTQLCGLTGAIICNNGQPVRGIRDKKLLIKVLLLIYFLTMKSQISQHWSWQRYPVLHQCSEENYCLRWIGKHHQFPSVNWLVSGSISVMKWAQKSLMTFICDSVITYMAIYDKLITFEEIYRLPVTIDKSYIRLDRHQLGRG